MKIKELIRKIEIMRGGYAETEQKLLEYRDRNGGGITVAEIEARAGFQVCNCVIGHIEAMAFDQEVDFG